ncbi:MAG TPA: quinolinate synthase NadA [Firmicutes bacterium]|nr:quinolinate synthase NadA [Bacillota bacterium]
MGFTTRELQDKILKLKKEKDAVILAHSYQSPEILEIADKTGDSFQLSLAAKDIPQQTVILCGVHFMAETVKILSPEKQVLLAHPGAGCAMARQVGPEYVTDFKKSHPGYAAVCYINTTAALKTVCDVCVTSSSAAQIVQKMEQKDILFLPDCNLGAFVAAAVPDKNITLFDGGCPIHASVTKEEAEAAKAAHPEAKLLVHPECLPEVSAMADYLGSTAGIMQYARQSEASSFIIGTEMSIAAALSYEMPEKHFYLLSPKLICPDMRLTNLLDVCRALEGTGGERIELDADTIRQARRCIDEMIRLGA